MDSVGGFKLRNNGGFVCAGKMQYIDLAGSGGTSVSDRWGFIPLGQEEMMMDPGDKGVPAGAAIMMYIDIEAGDDRTGGQYFLWDPNSTSYAEYDITGTTLDSSVHFDGIKTQ
jgi:hypothetical protein